MKCRLTTHSTVAGAVFYVAKANFLPRIQANKAFRWDYDYIEIGDAEFEYSPLGQKKNEDRDEDDWCVGSSSSFSPGPETPSDDAASLWDSETLASQSDTEGKFKSFAHI